MKVGNQQRVVAEALNCNLYINRSCSREKSCVVNGGFIVSTSPTHISHLLNLVLRSEFRMWAYFPSHSYREVSQRVILCVCRTGRFHTLITGVELRPFYRSGFQMTKQRSHSRDLTATKSQAPVSDVLNETATRRNLICGWSKLIM